MFNHSIKLIARLYLLLVLGVVNATEYHLEAINGYAALIKDNKLWFKLYIDPNGSDSHSGLSKEEPVATLAKVQQILTSKNIKQPIQVFIGPGVYFDQNVKSWTFVNGYPIKFMPSDPTTRPVFDGIGFNKKESWFTLDSSGGQATYLHFTGLQVQNYQNAITFKGHRDYKEQFNGDNIIDDMVFVRIGSKYSAASKAYSAVTLVNSKNNLITNSSFYYIENDGTRDNQTLMHAIYIAHHSSENTITHNRIRIMSGDPIRVRDESNDNDVKYNIISSEVIPNLVFEDFNVPYFGAYYSHWHQYQTQRSASDTEWAECPSYRNRFRYNTLFHLGSAPRLFKYHQDEFSCGVTSEWRLKTVGNQILGLYSVDYENYFHDFNGVTIQ